MVQELAPPVRRRRLGAHGMMLRRKRIFAGLREGLRYDEIAAQESVTTERIRQIVTEVLKNRSVDSGRRARQAAIGPPRSGFADRGGSGRIGRRQGHPV